MQSPFSRFSGADVQSGLEDQVSRLTHELSSLKKFITRQGSSAYAGTRETAGDLRESATDIYSDLWDRFQDALPVVRKRAREVEQVAKDNPATAAAVGLLVVGLVAILLLRGSSSRAEEQDDEEAETAPRRQPRRPAANRRSKR